MTGANKRLGTFALLALGLVITGCSNKKYVSWSECMSSELKELKNVGAVETYCDSNYDMTPRERTARKAWYCSGKVGDPECMTAPTEAATAETVEMPAEENVQASSAEGAEALAQSDAVPVKVGQCTSTRIKAKYFRIEGDPNSGSAIEYTNGVYGVDYEVIPQLEASRTGDPIRLCLTYVPVGCPAGDNRGKTYSAVNQRTKSTWELADSPHSCGGA